MNIKTSITAMILLIAAVSMAAAEDAPSMWMEQTPNGAIDLMVNTSENSSGANAWIHFDPACVNISDIDFSDSPWQPMEGMGWTHQTDHVCIALTNFDGVDAGEYKIATIAVECIGSNCTSQIEITKAEPIGVVVTNTTYTCTPKSPTKATISIGDGRGCVVLPIMITDATDVGAVDVTLSYDPAMVAVRNITAGAMDVTISNLDSGDGWVRICAYQTESPGMSGEFALASISLEPVGVGTCPLTLSVATFKDATPEGTAMAYTISNGKYTEPRNGDADGDGDVDLGDAMYIAKHVIGIDGCETIDEDCADVNGDGVVDVSDSMYLAKHVLGIPGFDELR